MSINFNGLWTDQFDTYNIVKMDINTLEKNYGRGYLKIWLGPMYSGKTQMLVRELHRLADTGCNVLYINHSIDNRTNTDMSTHSTAYSTVHNLKTVKTNNLNIDIDEYDVIGVDECQFYDSLDQIINWVDIKGKLVLCSGLDGDFERKPIGKILNLIPYCDSVEKLNAKCHMCIKEFKEKNIPYRSILNSPFTYRSNNNKNQILVSDDYLSLCRYHYLTKK